MAMTIEIAFTQEQIDELEYERYHHPDPKVQRKAEVLYLKSFGLPHQTLQEICRISSRTTLSKHLKTYQEAGMDGLQRQNYAGRKNELMAHAASLEEIFQAPPPRTSAHAQDIIEKQTGIRRSPTQVRAFMKRLGMRYRKVGYVPGKATDPAKQAEQEAFRSARSRTAFRRSRSRQTHCPFYGCCALCLDGLSGCPLVFHMLLHPLPFGS